jgi:hypothetical protein
MMPLEPEQRNNVVKEETTSVVVVVLTLTFDYKNPKYYGK